MEKDKPLFDDAEAVCVFPYQDGWTVGLCGGHYAFPLSKEEAIQEAFRHAMEANFPAVVVRDTSGRVEQRLPLESLPADAMVPYPARDPGEAMPDVPCECIHSATCKARRPGPAPGNL